MNAHGLLLALVTSAFMFIWDADRAGNRRAIVAPELNADMTQHLTGAGVESVVGIHNRDVKTNVNPSARAITELQASNVLDLTSEGSHIISNEHGAFRITIERVSEAAMRRESRVE